MKTPTFRVVCQRCHKPLAISVTIGPGKEHVRFGFDYVTACSIVRQAREQGVPLIVDTDRRFYRRELSDVRRMLTGKHVVHPCRDAECQGK